MTRTTRLIAWWTVAIVVLLAAAFLRFYRLDVVPPGMPIDEMVDGAAVRAIVAGWRPVFIPQGWGREPLYHYLAAPLFLVLHDPQMTIRLTSAWIGLAFVVAIGALTAQIANAKAGLLAAAFAAVTYWSVFASRYGVRNITLPLVSTLTVTQFFRAIRSERPQTARLQFALAGVLLGLTFYTYQSSRLLPILFVALCFWFWRLEREHFRARWKGLLIFFAVGLAIGAPLFVYLLMHPDAEAGRAFMLEPLDAIKQGNLGPLAESVWATVRFFAVDAGDWTYNVPGQPVFPWVASLLFCIGLLACLIQWRDPKRIVFPIWFLLGILPTMVTSGPHYFRLIGALAPAMALLGIGLVEASDWLARRFARERQAQASAILLLVIGAIAVSQSAWTTWRNYFETWAVNPHVRTEHDANLREVARYLDHSSDATPVVIAAQAVEDVEPDRFGNMLQRTDLDQRWFDASTAIVFPGGMPAARYIFRPETPLRAVFTDYLAGAPLVAEQHWQDGPLTFKVYQLDVLRARAAAQSQASWPLDASIAAPVSFGEYAELLGYSVPLTIAHGSPLRLLTTWRVTKPPTPGPSGIFVHLLDATGQIVAQDDHLGFPRHSWHVDDLFVQFSRLDIPPTLPSRKYTLQIGLYDKDTQARWPATDATGAAVGDHLVLGQIVISDK